MLTARSRSYSGTCSTPVAGFAEGMERTFQMIRYGYAELQQCYHGSVTTLQQPYNS